MKFFMAMALLCIPTGIKPMEKSKKTIKTPSRIRAGLPLAKNKSIRTFRATASNYRSCDFYFIHKDLIVRYAKENNICGLISILNKSNLFTQDHAYKRTALHWSLEKGYLQAAQLVISAAACYHHHYLFDMQDVNGDTPLHLAARHGYTPIVERLLCKGASPSIKNCDGFDPLLEAEWEGNHKAADHIRKEILERNSAVQPAQSEQ